MLWKVEQNRHLARRRQAARQASRQAARLWKLQQRRDLARMRQALEAGLEAMEIAAKERRAWLG